MIEQTIALERVLAAMIEEAGGEIRVSYDSFVRAHDGLNRYLVIDITDDGATLAFSLAEENEVPKDVR